MVQGLPTGRGLVAALYATGHSSLGTPSARYVSEVMRLFQEQPMVEGTMVYTLQAPGDGSGGGGGGGGNGGGGGGGGPCKLEDAPLYGGDKGCIVGDIFGGGN